MRRSRRLLPVWLINLPQRLPGGCRGAVPLLEPRAASAGGLSRCRTAAGAARSVCGGAVAVPYRCWSRAHAGLRVPSQGLAQLNNDHEKKLPCLLLCSEADWVGVAMETQSFMLQRMVMSSGRFVGDEICSDR